MAVSTSDNNVLVRIDAIMQELAELRQLVIAQNPDDQTTGQGIAHQLYGSLGSGTWNEWESDSTWQRFDQ